MVQRKVHKVSLGHRAPAHFVNHPDTSMKIPFPTTPGFGLFGTFRQGKLGRSAGSAGVSPPSSQRTIELAGETPALPGLLLMRPGIFHSTAISVLVFSVSLCAIFAA